jgi:hypothetical protein
MAKNTINDLRDHLFAQLERLSDDQDMKNPLVRERELQRANAIKQVADGIVSTVKVEIDYLRAVNSVGGAIKTNFIKEPEAKQIDGEKS